MYSLPGEAIFLYDVNAMIYSVQFSCILYERNDDVGLTPDTCFRHAMHSNVVSTRHVTHI